MTEGRWMGLDLGRVWWGVSLSDITRRHIQPLAVLSAQDMAAAVRTLRRWVKDYGVVQIIVGLPLLEGRWTRTTELVFAQAGYLRRRLGNIAVGFIDESETSLTARLHVTLGEREDAWAAAEILQRALDQPDSVLSWDTVRAVRERWLQERRGEM